MLLLLLPPLQRGLGQPRYSSIRLCIGRPPLRRGRGRLRCGSHCTSRLGPKVRIHFRRRRRQCGRSHRTAVLQS